MWRTKLLIWLVALVAAASLSARCDQAWEFNANGNTEGWTAGNNTTALAVQDGRLTGEAIGPDAWINGPRYPDIDADACKYAYIRMKISSGWGAEFFWGSAAEPWPSASRHTTFYLGATNSFQDCLIDLSAHPEWHGSVNSLRIDPTWNSVARFEIDFVRITSAPPVILDASVPSASDRFAFVGDTFNVCATVRNNGLAAASNVHGVLTVGRQTLLSPQDQSVSSLPVHGEATLTWQVQATTAALSNMTLSVSANNSLNTVQTRSILVVSSPRPALPSGASSSAFAWTDTGGNAVIENSKLRLAFTRSPFGFGEGEFYIRQGTAWNLAAALAPLSRATYQATNGSTTALALVPTSASATLIPGGAQLVLAYDNVDTDGIHWRGTLTYTLMDADDVIRVRYALLCGGSRRLLAWVGPGLCPGNRSFGTAKSQALFPGLEWLVGSERSSNSLEVDWPACIRVVPNPYKITTPLMAVSGNGNVIALLWDPTQRWDGVNICPAAKFSSPNWYETQNNSLMELFVPSVPKWTSENSCTADIPYVLDGPQLSMEAHYFGKPGEVLDAESKWYSLFGPAAMPGAADQVATGLSLARSGMTTTLWCGPNQGWYPGLNDDGSPAAASSPETNAAADLFADSLSEPDAAKRDALRTIANAGIQHAISLWGTDGLGYRLPYFAGHVDEMLNRMGSDVSAIVSSQQADGGWLVPVTYSSVDGRPLTTPGTKELGSCAGNAAQLLTIARTTGNATALSAGIKALNYMTRFTIPRAAQVWEIPQHAPDVLAAAYGVYAYVNGYILTGNVYYLNDAKYWALAGLPFIYQWCALDRQIMAYASIPVYGASNFGGAWFGVPVQWNGLDYADALLQLAKCDDSMPWKTIAEGIIRSGSQQIAASKFLGTLPDSLNIIYTNTTNPAYLHNFPFYGPASELLDRWNEIDQRKIRVGLSQAYISSGGKIRLAAADAAGAQCVVRVDYPVSETCYVVVAGLSAPCAVYKGSQQLANVTDVDSAYEGWSYDPSLRATVIKEVQTAENQTLSLVYSGDGTPISEVSGPESAKVLPDGTIVVFRGEVTGEFQDAIYVQDEQAPSGVRVELATSSLLPISEGDQVEVMGSLGTHNGERAVQDADMRVLR